MSCLCLLLAGCPAATKPSSFQMRFVPPVPVPPPADEAVEPPPSVPDNIYLAANSPHILLEEPRVPPRPTLSDLVMVKAEEAFQSGRKLYTAGKKEAARRQFDKSVDLMFEAGANPTNRASFERRFDEMVSAVHRMDLAGLDAAAPIEEPQFEKTPLEDILEMTFPVDPKLKRKVKEELHLTQSQLPLSVNDSVLGFIHYFSGRGHSTIVAGLRRAGRYRPMIQRILAEEGVPQELIHLAQAESGFFPRAVSRMKATGMWQFVAFRGEEYGLKRTPHYDDRLDPERATRAAARHLRDLYRRYGDWYLAIAAYNCGPGNVDRAIERTGYADFWELRARRTLPLETTNYVPIILAMTIMAKNAKEYDLDHVQPEEPLEYDAIKTTAPTSLALVADLAEVPVSQIHELNPALLTGIAPEGYSLRVPKPAGASISALLQTIPRELMNDWRMRRVEAGETLAGLSRKFGTTAQALARANRLEAESLAEGDRILVPQPYRIGTPIRSKQAQPARHASSAKTRRPAVATAASKRAPVKRSAQTAMARARRG
jgi:peptidoglycan lytic transglycosylase D